MFEKDRWIHNRHSLRKKWFDYSKPGMFFITICTHHGCHYFGDVIDRHMVLNNGGQAAYSCWEDIPKHFPDAKLHEFVVMPNHVHGIIETVQTNWAGNSIQGSQCIRSGAESFQSLNEFNMNKYQKMLPRSISSIIKGYKIGVTKWYRQNTDVNIIWQPDFWDVIVYNQRSYDLITRYIKNNPAKWNADRFFKVS